MSAPDSEPKPEPGGDPLAWWQDARRAFQLVQTEGLTVLRRRAPEVLDQVSELAGALAATLRAMDAGLSTHDPAGLDPAADVGGPATPQPSAATPLPSTVRIDVQD